MEEHLFNELMQSANEVLAHAKIRKPPQAGEWIGFDLDGTLAKYDGWQGARHIGAPIAPMVNLLKSLRQQGYDVRIYTARIAEPDPEERWKVVRAIEAWCQEHLGEVLLITNMKDYGMIHVYDDRAMQVENNTGELVQDQRDALRSKVQMLVDFLYVLEVIDDGIRFPDGELWTVTQAHGDN